MEHKIGNYLSPSQEQLDTQRGGEEPHSKKTKLGESKVVKADDVYRATWMNSAIERHESSPVGYTVRTLTKTDAAERVEEIADCAAQTFFHTPAMDTRNSGAQPEQKKTKIESTSSANDDPIPLLLEELESNGKQSFTHVVATYFNRAASFKPCDDGQVSLKTSLIVEVDRELLATHYESFMALSAFDNGYWNVVDLNDPLALSDHTGDNAAPIRCRKTQNDQCRRD